MKTLFNTELNEVGRFRSTPYTVNGKPGTLPENIVELDVIQGELPTGKKEISREWIADIELKQYREIVHWREYTEQEIALQEWQYTDYALRIVVPIELTLQFPQFEVWFRLNDLPVIRRDKQILLYCNEILKEHQQVFDELKDVIKIEKMP